MTTSPAILVYMRLCRLPVDVIAEGLGVSVARASELLAHPEIRAACVAAEQRIRSALRGEIAEWVIAALDEVLYLAGLPGCSNDPGGAEQVVAAAIEADPEARFSNPAPLSPMTVAQHLSEVPRRPVPGETCLGRFAPMNIAMEPKVNELITHLGNSSPRN